MLNLAAGSTFFINCLHQKCSDISYTLYLLRAARLKEEEETKARKEAAAKRMAEAKARAEVSNEYLIPCPTLIIPKLNVAIR